jgi:hypothetical protein
VENIFQLCSHIGYQEFLPFITIFLEGVKIGVVLARKDLIRVALDSGGTNRELTSSPRVAGENT